jgi:hypothetical protein
MSNQVAIIKDGFSTEERKNGNSLITGRILKFKDSGYTVDKESFASGGRYFARDVATVWTHWEDGEPVEHRITEPGGYHPDRSELPDQDQNLWPIGLGGTAADPWRDSRYLHLVCQQSGADYTFISDTHGGRQAVGQLKDQIRNVRYAHPGAMPIIALGMTPMKTKYGMRQRPQFVVVGWVDKHQGAAPLLLNKPAATQEDDRPPWED